MPITHAMKELSDGALYVRTLQTGKVTAADAKHLMHLMAPGQPLHGLPLLSVIESGSEFEAEARKIFTSMADPATAAKSPRVAVVVASAPLLVMMSFIIRITGAEGFTRFFNAEADALSWLGAAAQVA